MATHSSVLAWRTPGTGEPGGLPSMGSHRVGHDWSDLAAVAAASSWKCHFFCPYYYFCCHVAVYLLSRIWRFETPWTAAHQALVLHHLPELAQALAHWVADAVRWFARYRILVWHCVSFSIYRGHSLVSWPPLFLKEKSDSFSSLFSCMRWIFFPVRY